MSHNPSSALQDMSKGQVLYILLQKEAGYYDAIAKLIEQEKQLLLQGSLTKEVLSINKKKQLLFSCIEDLEAALVPLKRRWTKGERETDCFFQKVQQELIRLDKILQEILAADRKNQQLMRQHLASLSNRKKALNKES